MWLSAITRDAGGHELARPLPGGVELRWQRSPSGLALAQALSVGRSSLLERRLTWSEGKLAVVYEAVEGVSERFDHDARGHLIAAQTGERQTLRAVDEVGRCR